MIFNDHQLMMELAGFFVTVARREFPSWGEPDKKRECPPRCCTGGWAQDAAIMHSPGVGAAFEKLWRW